MLTALRIDPDAPQDWTWDGTRYTAAGGGLIEPYQHPMTEHTAITDGVRTVIIVRERARQRALPQEAQVRVGPGDLDQVASQARRWPADFLLIQTERYRPVRVTAGPARTTPLYLAHRDGVLHGSWDMPRLRQLATGLNPKEATRMLAYHPRYSYETTFTGIWRLTERATATFSGDLYIRYPDPVLHARSRDLADGGDVLAAFAAAIDAALGLRPLDPQATVFHLTGGLDSGSIAAQAARRWPEALSTATLVITGAGREHQVRRRREMLACIPFGPQDIQIDLAGQLMFGPGCDRTQGTPVSPYDEPLYEHMSSLNARIAELGARVVVSGLGGDEMVAVGSAESQQAAIDKVENFDLPWLGPAARAALPYGDDQIAPPAMAGGITLLAAECVAPPLLRAGLWPVHPFTEPPLVMLGDQLPFHWRELKQLQRRHLAAFGLSQDACNPRVRESFAELVEESLLTNGLPLLHRILDQGSPLIEAGLLDPDGLKSAVIELETGPYSEDPWSKVVEVITLDQAARAFLP
ncbi:MAG TPA: asparagine synthase [Trebonia sp.]|nr:asparagine synthase [Trebonia sp.]